MPRSSSALARSFGLTATLALGATAALAHADVRAEPAWIWTSEAASPRLPPPNALSESEAGLERLCGRPEAGLREVAARLAERKVLDLPFLDAEGVAQSQRVAGEPHVWPHAWVLSGQTLDHAATRQKLAAWGATFHENGERRCGLASRRGADGTEVIAAVALDALADLSPLPTETHVGTWLSVEARLLVPASGARVVVMGPTGLPRSVPTQLQGGRIRAQLALDRPGAFTVQIVADTAQGPRPVLEAELFADKTPGYDCRFGSKRSPIENRRAGRRSPRSSPRGSPSITRSPSTPHRTLRTTTPRGRCRRSTVSSGRRAACAPPARR